MTLVTRGGFLGLGMARQFVEKGQEPALLSCIKDHLKTEIPSFVARWTGKRARQATRNLQWLLILTLIARRLIDNIFRPVGKKQDIGNADCLIQGTY